MTTAQNHFSAKTSLYKLLGLVCLLILVSCTSSNISSTRDKKAALYIIGDSTVKNGQGNGSDGLWGWGNFIEPYFDTTKITIHNHAIGGRSSRTFITEGRWDRVLEQLQPGDFVLIQFGHNDGGPMATGRARASIKGNGDETVEVTLEATGENEVVHSYGWYLRKYIRDAKAKGATPIILSPVPRNIWKEGKVARASEDYGLWASEAAKATKADFVDLNEIIAQRYEQTGQDKVDSDYFLTDHTHTTKEGAKVNAAAVIEGIRGLKKHPLTQYMAE